MMMTLRRLSEAQQRRLSLAPDNWKKMPMFGDSRPNAPLARFGLIEVRSEDVTPADWKGGHFRIVKTDWRITAAGRLALANGETVGETK